MADTAAGVIVALGDALRFVPATVAERIMARPVVTRVPGTELGMALVAGRVVTVIELDKRRDELLVCEVDGEHVGLSGLSVRDTGFFEKCGDGVMVDGVVVPLLDVGSELRIAERAMFARRASNPPWSPG